jgi:hypothetical protein
MYALARDGEQVFDLEGLASHRGSAFRRGRPAGAALAPRVRAQRPPRRRRSGPPAGPLGRGRGPVYRTRGFPAELVDRSSSAPIVELRAPFEARVRRIVATSGWRADVMYVRSSENRSHGATVGVSCGRGATGRRPRTCSAEIRGGSAGAGRASVPPGRAGPANGCFSAGIGPSRRRRKLAPTRVSTTSIGTTTASPARSSDREIGTTPDRS